MATTYTRSGVTIRVLYAGPNDDVEIEVKAAREVTYCLARFKSEFERDYLVNLAVLSIISFCSFRHSFEPPDEEQLRNMVLRLENDLPGSRLAEVAISADQVIPAPARPRDWLRKLR